MSVELEDMAPDCTPARFTDVLVEARTDLNVVECDTLSLERPLAPPVVAVKLAAPEL